MEIHFDPFVYRCRIYPEDAKGSYKRKEQYIGSFVLTLSDDVAEVTMLTGRWDQNARDQLMEFCKKVGATEVRYYHKRRRCSINLTHDYYTTCVVDVDDCS